MFGRLSNDIIVSRLWHHKMVDSSNYRHTSAMLHTWMVKPPRKSVKNSFAAQKFDFFLVLDFEATCQRNVSFFPAEIIEFPVLKVDSKTFNVVSTFHEYVRPVKCPTLSPFCIELTGITQDMVHNADDFPVVWGQYNRWMEENELHSASATFVTCGDWDLKKMLPEQLRISGLPSLTPQNPLSRWINIKRAFQDVEGYYPRSMNTIMSGLSLQFEGCPHSGIDDAKNIAIVLRALAGKGYVFSNNSNVLGS